MVYLAGPDGGETKLGFGQDQPTPADKGQNDNTTLHKDVQGCGGFALSCGNSCATLCRSISISPFIHF